jgi:hypothetical protein
VIPVAATAISPLRICIVGKYPPIEGGVSVSTYWLAYGLPEERGTRPRWPRSSGAVVKQCPRRRGLAGAP